MELPRRIGRDRFSSVSPLTLARDLSVALGQKRYSAVVVYPYDQRTELGPFYGASKRMAMAGPRLVGSMLDAAGFETRIVQQVWNPHFRPSCASLNGRPIDLLGISAMQIHNRSAQNLIRDAYSMGEQRPFIVAGGPQYVYQPWDAWSGEEDTWPDVAVTGECHVLLSLLLRMQAHRRGHESLRQTFERLRNNGDFQDIPGLMFLSPDNKRELINTGVAQLSQNLEDRPFTVDGLRLYEQPGRHAGLLAKPLPLAHLARLNVIAVQGFTEGCTLNCPYCPIPARMQKSYRFTDPEFVEEDLRGILAVLGKGILFYGDDSLFNTNYTERLWGHLAGVRIGGRTLRENGVWIGTEAVLANVAKRINVLDDAAPSGLGALWFGIEALDPRVIDKGQNLDNIKRVFRRMRELGISPMAMTILFPGQGWRGNNERPYGARETAKWLHQLGATSLQMTHIMPSLGSKDYDGHFQRGEVLSHVGRYPVDGSSFDGNRVILDFHPEEKEMDLAQRQIWILGAYWIFYSPAKLFRVLVNWFRAPSRITGKDLRFRVYGFVQTLVTSWKMLPWIWALWRGPWKKYGAVPHSQIPIRVTQNPSLIKKTGLFKL